MRKILVVAKREYQAAVKTKAFLVTLILMPVMMIASGGVQALFRKFDDKQEKRFAILDRTPDQVLAKGLEAAVEAYNQNVAFRVDTGKGDGPPFKLEVIAPATGDDAAKKLQRYELSQRVEKRELEGILEIGSKVLEPGERFPDVEIIEDDMAIRFQARNPTQAIFRRWADRTLNQIIQLVRFGEKGVLPDQVEKVQRPVLIKNKSLTRLDPATGEYREDSDKTQIVNLLLPVSMIGIMFMIIVIGATPAMQGVVEEKQQRIAEVLLGSLSPSELMAGKLLGVVAVSLTMAGVYLTGGYILADQFDMTQALSLKLVLTFFWMLVLALLIYGSLFIAVGAAANDLKESQTLLTPIMLIASLPFFALAPIMADPNGTVARIASAFPFSTPVLLTARQSVPPGVPLWELVVGSVITLATCLFCVWAAGRIFRIGFLMQGQGVKFGDLIKWIFKG
jgi:ABC-2 type transport system permease protein